MSVAVFVEIECDLDLPECDEMVGPEPTRAEAARRARSEGWKIGRRSGTKPRYDICPSCQRSANQSVGGLGSSDPTAPDGSVDLMGKGEAPHR